MEKSASLLPNEVHVWQVALEAPCGESGQLGWLLSADEMARAMRFRFPQHRERWIAARHALREVLSRYAGIAASALVFETNEYGKPSIAAGAGGRPVRFNLSHSGDIALIAVAKQDVGVDVEYIDPDFEWEPLTAQVFSDAESAMLRASLPELQRRRFYELWTGKEAYIKARGLGLAISLKDFSLPAWAGSDSGVLIEDRRITDLRSWHLFRLPVPGAYAASLVCAPSGARICHIDWPTGIRIAG